MQDIPLLLFVYNRPRHLRRTLRALAANRGAGGIHLVIHSDGPRTEKEEPAVQEVRRICRHVRGFRTTRIVKREKNLGLAASIRLGVTEVLEEAEAVMVMEDDLITSPWFLGCMRKCLKRYAGDERLLSVSGYLPPRWRLRPPGDRPDVWLATRPMSWGWGTWKDSWNSVDWERAEEDRFLEDSSLQKGFAASCGTDVPGMLRAQLEGRIDSWAIRFAYEHWRTRRYAVLPADSYVKPIGFDGTGRNCRPNPLRWFETLRHAKPNPEFPTPPELHPGMQKALTRFFDQHHRWIGRFVES